MDLLEGGGISALIFFLVQLMKRAYDLSDKTVLRLIPLLAIALGIAHSLGEGRNGWFDLVRAAEESLLGASGALALHAVKRDPAKERELHQLRAELARAAPAQERAEGEVA